MDAFAQGMVQRLRSHALMPYDHHVALCSWVAAVLTWVATPMASAALSAGLVDALLDLLHSRAPEVR